MKFPKSIKEIKELFLENKSVKQIVFKNIINSFLNRTILWQFSLSQAKRYLPRYKDSVDDILKIKGKLESIWEAKDLKERQFLDINKYSVPAP